MSKVRKIFGIYFKTPNSMSDQEAMLYAEWVQENHPDWMATLHMVTIHLVDDEEVELEYQFDVIPFERIRRITGYLAETKRWNPAKQAELADRVTHNV